MGVSGNDSLSLSAGMKRLAEPARVPCTDYPPDYAPRKGEAAVVDVRKALWWVLIC